MTLLRPDAVQTGDGAQTGDGTQWPAAVLSREAMLRVGALLGRGTLLGAGTLLGPGRGSGPAAAQLRDEFAVRPRTIPTNASTSGVVRSATHARATVDSGAPSSRRCATSLR